MNLTEWTDAELISIREKLHSWCLQREASTWTNKFLNWTGYAGAFALLTGLTDVFFGGPTILNGFLIVLGLLACFSWYRGDKQRKKNKNFLEELNQEFTRRKLEY